MLSPGDLTRSDGSSQPSSYRTILLVVACITLLVAFVRIAIDTYGMWEANGTPSQSQHQIDYTTIALLITAAAAFVLIHFNVRLKVGGTEVELNALVGTSNATELATTDLEARISGIEKTLQTSAGGETRSAAEAESPAKAKPPALSRPQVRSDDPWKHRFGGEASKDGYKLTASFREKTSDLVQIQLVVEATENKKRDQTIEFFLHPTFQRDQVSARMTNGMAKLNLLAWGGFTVGVWIPDDKVELELDLAELPNAPPVIRYK